MLSKNDQSQCSHQRRHSNLRASQTLRFSSISNNLLSLNNIETELDAIGIVQTLGTDRLSLLEESLNFDGAGKNNS